MKNFFLLAFVLLSPASGFGANNIQTFDEVIMSEKITGKEVYSSAGVKEVLAILSAQHVIPYYQKLITAGSDLRVFVDVSVQKIPADKSTISSNRNRFRFVSRATDGFGGGPGKLAELIVDTYSYSVDYPESDGGSEIEVVSAQSLVN
jgi:hypothetical protein